MNQEQRHEHEPTAAELAAQSRGNLNGTRDPTAAELASQSRGNAPWECPGCGCRDLRGENSSVESTRHPDGKLVTKRKRVCRHCGKHGITTFEVHVPAGYKAVIVPDDAKSSDLVNNTGSWIPRI